MAALLLATSCSKDSDNSVVTNPTPVETQDVSYSTETDCIPFSIKVVTDNSLSKIGYADDGSTVNPSFTDADVTAELKMSISEGATELGSLTLRDTDGNFSGNLDNEPSADGATLTATITTTGDATSSTVSIADLMEKCAHKYTGTFTYKTDTQVKLTDDKAYIEILMSPLQHNIDVTIGGEKKNYAMSNDGKVWIAVDDGTTFTMNFTTVKTTTAGKITTIKREGLVDLGLSDGTLWADKNVGATKYDGVGTYYNHNDAKQTVSGKLEMPDRIDNDNSDFCNLYNECSKSWVASYNDGSQAGYVLFKNGCSDIAKDPHIFLPAVGYYSGSTLNGFGMRGDYWSKASSGSSGYVLNFSSVENDFHRGNDYYSISNKAQVRLIRRKN